MSDALDTGQIILFLTTLVGIIVTLVKDRRARAWAVEDRATALAVAAQQRKDDLAAIVEHAQAEADALRIKSEAVARALAVETRANSQREAEKIRLAQDSHAARLETQMRDLGAVAAQAYDAANHVNDKILQQQQIMVAQTAKRDGQMAALKTQIESVHQAADAAYTEANHVNIKIAALNERLIGQQDVADKEAAESRTVGQATLDGVTEMAAHGTAVAREVLDVVQAIQRTPPDTP